MCKHEPIIAERAKFLIVDEPMEIAEKRKFIMHKFETGKILMMDDDLRFARRTNHMSTKLTACDRTEELSDLLSVVEDKLDEFAHVGITMRQGNNRKEGDWSENDRMQGASLGYNLDIVLPELEFCRVKYREDMDYTLQLLRKGFENRVLALLAVDDCGGHNAKGGCSEFRTLEASNESAVQLAELHPGLVRLVEKEYKGTRNRTEVVIYWKKAFKESQRESNGLKV